MDESDKIVLKIIEILLPEWLDRKNKQYPDLDGYDFYRQIVLDAFEFDMERAAMEQERSADFTGLERKLEIMKLNQKLKEEAKKKKRRKK